jgi:endonuclease III
MNAAAACMFERSDVPDPAVRSAAKRMAMTSIAFSKNALLVPFGKHICTGTRPKCSTCPLLQMCRQVGVTSHR